MNVYFVTFRSVTPAQRGERLLQKRGYRCSLQRTPRWMEEQGCGYCLRLRTAEIGQCVQQLQSGGIPFRRVYRQTADGGYEVLEL